MKQSNQQPLQSQKNNVISTSIHYFLIIFIFLSSNSILGQSMGDLFDGMKKKDDVEKFAKDPKKFIKDKLISGAKNKLKDAAFGPDMSAEMANVFKRVTNKHDSSPKGGACPMAAHGNASSILFDLKYQGQTMLLPKTSAKIIGSILNVQKGLKDFLKGKAKSEIQDKIKEYYDGLPIETFSDTGSKQGCDFSVVATIDYAKKKYEVIIVADCKCQPVRIPLRKGSGVVEGWKLFASGPLTMTKGDAFIKAKIGRVKRYNFIPACNCNNDDENNSNMFSGGSQIKIGENSKKVIEKPTLECDELAKLIAETEKKLDQIRKMKRDIKKKSKANEDGEEMDSVDEDEIEKLTLDYDAMARFIAGLLMDWNKYCGNADLPKLSALELAHLKNALLRLNGNYYRNLNEEEKKQHEKRVEEAEKKEKPKIKKNVKIGSSWSPPKGTTRIAAVGTVRNEKVMITSRGSIGGTVSLKDEDGEELTVVTPDEEGHFNIDFGEIGIDVATKLLLTRLDINGNELTNTTIDYLPEFPSVINGSPIINEPEIPYLENNQINELEGVNLGEGSEVVLTDGQGNEVLQETLSTTAHSAMYYLDGKVGPVELRVYNDYGNSEPLEFGIYEFNVRAGKMNLIRNEKTSLTGVYEGLPVGTRIVFTNESTNVTIKPDGKAKVSGNDVIFTVKKTGNEVKLKLKARRSGGWSISYRLEFPN